jgi:hypothetical protein
VPIWRKKITTNLYFLPLRGEIYPNDKISLPKIPLKTDKNAPQNRYFGCFGEKNYHECNFFLTQ